jgi:hypothetical protein
MGNPDKCRCENNGDYCDACDTFLDKRRADVARTREGNSMVIPDVDKLMAWENGDLSDKETVDFFASLVKSGLAWKLQGMYGRAAAGMIKEGLVSSDGQVLRYE